MNDQQLALALVQSGAITPQQVHSAAQMRAPGKDLAQVLLEAGWITAQQVEALQATSLTGPPPARAATPDGAIAGKNGSEPERVTITSEIGIGQENARFQGGGVVIEGEMAMPEDEELGQTALLCNQLIETAVVMRASDLHLEPVEEGLQPRFRIDGHLRPGKLIPRESMLAVISRFKLLGRMNIAESRLSQDGRFRARVRGRRFDFRLSTLTVVHGEKLVMRLLDPSALVTDLTRLGLIPQVRETFESLLKRSHGMILVTGPTGSGKTTTLYAALSTTRDDSKNVVTVEDPVEYELKGIMQASVHAEIGNTFAARLRSILRQDPDVILVGEIRDTETAEMAVRSALTGHLVLSTLHTNSAAAAPSRLFDMGLPPYLIASSLNGVLAQRLVRTICRHCREPMPTDGLEYEMAITQWQLAPDTVLYRGAGCSECNEMGLRGRVALVELLEVNQDIRRAIMDKADAETVHRIAMRNGMATLYQDGMDKLLRGITTISELARLFLGPENADV